MSNEQHLSEDDLVLFALQFLPEDRMRDAAAHMKSCDSCRAQIAELQGELVAYAMTAGAAAPPVESRERLMRQIAKEPRVTAPVEPVPAAEPENNRQPRRGREPRGAGEPTFAARQSRTLSLKGAEEEEAAEETERRPRRAPWVLAWTGWAVAVGCSFLAGIEVHQRQQMQSAAAVQAENMAENVQSAERAQDVLATLTSAHAQQIALRSAVPTAPPKKGEATASAVSTPEALAAYLSQKGALVFIAMHLAPVAPGKTYQLWLLPADTTKNPIPAGTFRPDAQGNASIVMPQLPRGVAAKGFGVTVENAGGAATPTLPMALSGT